MVGICIGLTFNLSESLHIKLHQSNDFQVPTYHNREDGADLWTKQVHRVICTSWSIEVGWCNSTYRAIFDEVCDWRVKTCSHMEIFNRTCCSTSDPHHNLAQVNFLVSQTQVPSADKEDSRNLFRTRIFTFGGTSGRSLYLKLRSYPNLHELSWEDAH